MIPQRKEARLKKLWNVRLSAQMVCLPEFDEVYRAVLRELRKAGYFIALGSGRGNLLITRE